jgi:septal ring factor EnvC (AmiA/AmiB activator)
MATADASLSNWLLGALGTGILGIVALYFSGILSTLREVAKDLKEVVKDLAAQRTELALVKQQGERHETEIQSLRERQHDLASMLQAPVLRAGKGGG